MLGALAWVPVMWMAKHPGMARNLAASQELVKTRTVTASNAQARANVKLTGCWFLVPGFWRLEAGINSQLTSPT